jgi:acetyl esterase/lipase
MMEREVPADAPPMFVAIALDDNLFAAGKPLGLIDAYRAAKRPLEVHLYEKGGHGFGMSNRSAGTALWIDEFQAWMKDRGIIKAKK